MGIGIETVLPPKRGRICGSAILVLATCNVLTELGLADNARAAAMANALRHSTKEHSRKQESKVRIVNHGHVRSFDR